MYQEGQYVDMLIYSETGMSYWVLCDYCMILQERKRLSLAAPNTLKITDSTSNLKKKLAEKWPQTPLCVSARMLLPRHDRKLRQCKSASDFALHRTGRQRSQASDHSDACRHLDIDWSARSDRWQHTTVYIATTVVIDTYHDKQPAAAVSKSVVTFNETLMAYCSLTLIMPQKFTIIGQ